MKDMEPVSRNYGSDLKGGSIARYYIDHFIARCLEQHELSGMTVAEVGNDKYSRNISNCKKLIISNTSHDDRYLFADLETGEGCEAGIADAFILTNVLSCLYDVKAALKNSAKMVRNGGYLFITVPGIAQICQRDYQSYGQFWRFTPMCLERLIKETTDVSDMSIEIFGNVKAAAGLLYGQPASSLSEEELSYVDNDYPMLIGASVKLI